MKNFRETNAAFPFLKHLGNFLSNSSTITSNLAKIPDFQAFCNISQAFSPKISQAFKKIGFQASQALQVKRSQATQAFLEYKS